MENGKFMQFLSILTMPLPVISSFKTYFLENNEISVLHEVYSFNLNTCKRKYWKIADSFASFIFVIGFFLQLVYHQIFFLPLECELSVVRCSNKCACREWDFLCILYCLCVFTTKIKNLHWFMKKETSGYWVQVKCWTAFTFL